MPTTIKLADPPETLLFPEITLSNQQPLIIERHGIQHALDNALKTEREVNEILKLVQTRNQEYSERVALLQKALAPCRVLPPEIWSRIFCILMDIDDGDKVVPKKTREEARTKSTYHHRLVSLHKQLPPTIARLSLVCRMWRRSVLSTPSLWRHLPSEIISHILHRDTPKFDDEETWRASYNIALQAHLSRAGSIPLDMLAVIPSWDIDLPVNKEYLEILGTALPRLGFFNLSIMDDVGLSRFASLPQRFDNLKSLEVSMSSRVGGREDQAPETPWQLFDHAPLLSRLKISYLYSTPLISMTDRIAFPSSSVTHLEVEGLYVIDIYRLLKASLSLIEASFEVRWTVETVDQTIDWVQLESVTCPTLRIFKVVCSGSPQIDVALAKIDAPSLAHLEVDIPLSDLPNSSFPLAPSSLAHLTHLIVDCDSPGFGGQEWVSFFRQTPSITHLSLQWFPELRILLRSLANVTVDPLLPGLKFLMITAAGIEEDEGDLADPGLWWETELNAVAAARIQECPSPPLITSRLASLRITFHESAYHPDETDDRYNNPTFYRLNAWLTGEAPICPVYCRLMDAFYNGSGFTEAQRTSFLLLTKKLRRDDPDAREVLDFLRSVTIPDILEASADCKSHHIAEITDFGCDVVKLLETIRSCFTREEDVAGELHRKWKEMKTSYLEEPGWIQLEHKSKWGPQLALEYVPKRNTSPNARGSKLQVVEYPDLQSDIWWVPITTV